MPTKTRMLTVLGTRPEVIKLAPVVPAARSRPNEFEMLVVTTGQHRENQGEPMRQICRALLRLVDEFSDLRVVYPVHLSPAVREIVLPLLGDHRRIELLEPLEYRGFVEEMERAHLILTDSGGVQEALSGKYRRRRSAVQRCAHW